MSMKHSFECLSIAVVIGVIFSLPFALLNWFEQPGSQPAAWPAGHKHLLTDEQLAGQINDIALRGESTDDTVKYLHRQQRKQQAAIDRLERLLEPIGDAAQEATQEAGDEGGQ